MGDVLPFVGRYFSLRDWTGAERAQIQALAKSLGFQAAGIEVVYGASDAGDPWCVIKDDQENVLIHVARFPGGVVIHDMVADLVREGHDLWLALGRRLTDDVLPSREGDVADLSLGRREAQLMLSMVTASAFGLDMGAVFGADPAPGDAAPGDVLTSDGVVVAPDAAGPALVAPTAAPVEHRPEGAVAQAPDAAPRQGDVESRAAPEAQVHAAAGADQSRAPDVAAGEPVFDAPPTASRLVGGSGDDVLIGTADAEVIQGGDGDDVLYGGGAPQGQFDVLEGGAGDDLIFVRYDVVAAGGTGADTFVVSSPEPSDQGSGNLGVIVDFDELAGDKVRFDTAHKVTITSITPVTNILADAAGTSTVSASANLSGQRVGVDVDGDGVEDGYVLVAVQRGKIALGAGELDSSDPVGQDHIPSYGAELLAVGGTIWIDTEI